MLCTITSKGWNMTTTDGKLLLIVCAPKRPPDAPMPQYETSVEVVNIQDFDEQERVERAHEVDAILAIDHLADMIPDLHQFPNIKAILSISVGFDNFRPEMVPEGCLFVNTHGHEQPIADWVIMAMLMFSRDVNGVDKAFRTQTLRPLFEMGGMKPDMRDATVGVIGLGRVGRSIVETCRKFDMRCLVAMRTPISESEAHAAGIAQVYPIADLDKMLAECDYVVPTIPANADSYGMFGEAQFQAMKNTAFFINIARPEILDEKSIYEALTDGTIAGAAIDVWWNEDDLGIGSGDPERQKWSKYPFWELENVIMSPHRSSFSTAMMKRKQSDLAQQVDRLNRGEPLINIVPELSKG